MNALAAARRELKRTNHRRLLVEGLEHRRVMHAPGTPVLEFEVAHGVVANGGLVSQWTDQSANGNHVIATGSERPQFGVVKTPTNENAISFDGLDDRLLRLLTVGISGLPTGNASRTMFIVAQFHDAAAWGGVSYGAGVANQAFGIGTAGPGTNEGKAIVTGWGGGNDLVSSHLTYSPPAGPTTGWQVLTAVVDGNVATLYANGSQIASFAHSYNTNLSNTASINGTSASRLVLGEEIKEFGHIKFDLAAVLVYDTAVSPAFRSQVESYLTEEYIGAHTQAAFTDELVLTLPTEPLSLTNLPDGRMLVLEKTGAIKIFDPRVAVPTASAYLTVPNVQSNQERGLTDIAIDPNFATNGYFYVYFSNSVTKKVQISRFTHNFQTSKANPNSQVVIWQDPEVSGAGNGQCCHYGGGLDFGPDGKLYLTLGDMWNIPARSQDLTKAAGKILRLNPDGSIPGDNPTFSGATGTLPGVWAYGLRNPFRASWDIPTNRFFIGDVGGNIQSTAREEVNLGVAGANYGWHQVEGVSNNPNHTNPIFDYGHTSATPNGGAIAGGLVYRGSQYPNEYRGAYFFGDYVSGWIRYLKFDTAGRVIDANPATTQVDAFSFVDTPVAPVAFEVGQDGMLYYVDYFTKQVHRIRYSTGSNQAPVITSATATPTVGDTSPLRVTFIANATDAENDPLTYRWVFGDGTQSTQKNVSHTYQSKGSYTATLQVSDGNQTTVSEPILITVGQAPVIQSISPADNSTFRAGDTLTLSAIVIDDGPLNGSNYDWSVRFIHNAHTHPEISNVAGTTVQFEIPVTGHDFSDSTGFEIELKVVDSQGISTTKINRIYPQKVNVNIGSNFPGVLTYTLDGIPRPGNFVLDTAINFQHTLSVPPSVSHNGVQYTFSRWSNNSTSPTLTFTVPTVNSNLTAQYTQGGTSDLITQGLTLRLDAESGVTKSGTKVTQWSDFSGLGNNLTSIGNPQWVNNALNGRDVINFDGVGDRLVGIANGLPGGSSDRTVFMVARYDDNGYGGFAYGAPATNQTFGTTVAPNGNLAVQGWGNANDFISRVAGSGQEWLIQGAVLQSNQLKHYKNGVEIDTRTHAYNTRTGTESQIVIGAEIDGNPQLNMTVAEILVYDRALTTAERQQVEDYLRSKYFNGNLGGGGGTTVGGPAKLQSAIVNASTTGWTTVTLPQSYNDMVVVATPVTDKSKPSVTTRIRNAESGNTFEIMLQQTGTLGGNQNVSFPVHYTVVEAGVYTQARDGVKMEAFKTVATTTDAKGSYVGKNVTGALSNSYSNPVVVGQVMSFNDPKWSVFWSRGKTDFDPVSNNAVWVGKHVGSDPTTSRAHEQLGVVVIEQGSGTIGSFGYSAILGASKIDGVQNQGSSYPLTLSNPASAIASQTGMHGSDGGWAVLYGSSPLNGRLFLAIEEDQEQDIERNHANEHAAYILFNPVDGPSGSAAISVPSEISPVIRASDFTQPLDGSRIADPAGNNTLMIMEIDGEIDFTGTKVDVRGFNRIDLSSEYQTKLILDRLSIARLVQAEMPLEVVIAAGNQLIMNDAADWRMTHPVIVDGQFMLTAKSVMGGNETVRAQTENLWKNFLVAGDVNNSGDITAGDALEIVFELNRRLYSDPDSGILVEPNNLPQWPGLYLDRSGDNLVSALDALLVINDLYRQTLEGQTELEGEMALPLSTMFPSRELKSPVDRETDSQQAETIEIHNWSSSLPSPPTALQLNSSSLDVSVPSSASTDSASRAIDAIFSDGEFILTLS